ncbi:MAG: hypothetical protein Q8781_02000 [Candidatus Phytoplasma stylosanthis]|uniref:hypothetical protein n=1 Tax=Candidatus Phytoplasma stylosanthis TaxID=2798314 RepID=UPI002939F15B|nr:hypothetical protein [Candidatus Phytoplasma stylosanthis]MDV3155248.1 hypothetical protein [Sweet potato little leaf phytoplasma]MDV3171058.1 hypothetical protein [Candidatus Phytoplasma stylosanthis]MDV3202781.1 hypothetical protein [Candidatus Phytoplasma stylosanthis]
MNNLEKIIINVIFIIVNVVVICTPLYFVQKFLYNEIHQKFKEVRGKCECVDQKLDEDRKENNREFIEIWKNLAKLNKIFNESEDKLDDNLNKSDEITDKTETKIDEQKQE